MNTPTPHDSAVRCGNCNKLLAKGRMEAGELELVCPRCKTRLHLRADSPNLAPHDGLYGDSHERKTPPTQR